MSTLVLKPAPLFTAPAVMADDSIRREFSLKELEGQYCVLFFYPFDFSFVCPTELLALDHALEAFQERECAVVGISTDTHFTHLAWKKAPTEDGGIGPIRFPLVADLTKKISSDYGVLLDDVAPLRATVLVDREGIVRHMAVNDMDTGRSIPEILRTLDAIRHFDTTGETCPANWKGSGGPKGKPIAGIKKKVRTFDLGSG